MECSLAFNPIKYSLYRIYKIKHPCRMINNINDYIVCWMWTNIWRCTVYSHYVLIVAYCMPHLSAKIFDKSKRRSHAKIQNTQTIHLWSLHRSVPFLIWSDKWTKLIQSNQSNQSTSNEYYEKFKSLHQCELHMKKYFIQRMAKYHMYYAESESDYHIGQAKHIKLVRLHNAHDWRQTGIKD